MVSDSKLMKRIRNAYDMDNVKIVEKFRDKEWTKLYSKEDFPQKTFFLWFGRFMLDEILEGDGLE